MALTRKFKDTVQARVQADPAFGEALLREGIETMLGGLIQPVSSVSTRRIVRLGKARASFLQAKRQR